MTWVLSAITVTVMILAGQKHPLTWWLSLGNQFLWLGWIIHSKNWGLLPMNAALFVVATRNIFLWRRRPERSER